MGTIFFTLALKNGNPTVVNVILNIQPVISTLGAFLLFGDRLTPRFFLYAGIADPRRYFSLGGISGAHRRFVRASRIEPRNRLRFGLRALLGSFHRGRTRRHDRHAASAGRESAYCRRAHLHDIYPPRLRQTQRRIALACGRASPPRHRAIGALVLLASISGGIPLLIYFEGLRLTRASTAGYFEMMQTLAAVCITWGFFHATLHLHQVIAALVLMAAVFMVQKAQSAVEDEPQDA